MLPPASKRGHAFFADDETDVRLIAHVRRRTLGDHLALVHKNARRDFFQIESLWLSKQIAKNGNRGENFFTATIKFASKFVTCVIQ